MINRIAKNIPSRHLEHLVKKPKIEFRLGKLHDNYENAPPDQFNNRNTSFSSISFMTWNILASGYSRRDVFYYVDPEFLHEDHRFSMTYYDIMANFCDIICLQEVERRIFDKLLTLCNGDYYGIFEKRTGLTCDGLATFYKKNVLNQVDYEIIQLNKIPSSITNLFSEDKFLLKKLTSAHNIAQVLTFQPVDPKIREKIEYLIVVNLHLFWNPNKEIIKYSQALAILCRVNEMYRKLNNLHPGKICVVLGGDFNSKPDSNVVDLVKGKFMSARMKNENMTPTYLKLFNILQSAWGGVKLYDTHEENEYVTNIKPDFNAKIDHIFYTNENIFKAQEISFLDTNCYFQEKALPNSFHGSDHLYLISKFYL